MRIDIGGITINYEERGKGEPLLLTMGLGAPAAVWELHVQEYEKHFRCILMDNRGAGDSDKPAGPYSTRQMAEDAVGLLDKLAIKQTAIAGISMGSCIAQELAINHPGRVSRMVLVSSWSRCDLYTKAVFDHFKDMRAASSPEQFMRLLQLWIFVPDYFNSHDGDMREARAAAATGYMPLHAFNAQCDACIGHDTFDRLDKIKAPALLTVGDADIFTPLRLSKEMEARMPTCSLKTLKGLGHAHHWEDLAVFNKLTTTFLKTGRA